MPDLHLEIVTDEGRFLALREDWNALLGASRTPTVFLTWEWLHTWWRHLSDGAALRLLVLRDNERIAAIAPCLIRPKCLSRLWLIPSLHFLGTGSVGSDYLDVIVRPDVEAEALAALSGHLAQQSATVELPNMLAGARGRLLAAALTQRGWQACARGSDVCPFIPMAGRTWDGYLAGLGREHRYNFRRRLKHLQQHHGMRFDRVTTEEDESSALATLVRLHNERWSTRGGSTAFHTPSLVNFHREWMRLARSRGWLRLFVLSADDAPVSVFYGFSYDGTFSFYQAGFDVRSARLSVGMVTMGLAIREAIAEGVREFDFLHGSEDYKFLWARDRRTLERVDLFPPEVRGTVSRAAAHAYRRVRRFARRVVQTGRRAIGPAVKEVASA